MSQLRQHQTRLEALKVKIKIVVFDDDFMARAYAKETKLDWPLLIDKERELYAAYGMTRGSWWDIFNPVSIAKYIWLMIRGQKPGKPGNDWRQMGGEVLIDPNGIVQLHHASSNPHDRPSIDEIFCTVESSLAEASSRSA